MSGYPSALNMSLSRRIDVLENRLRNMGELHETQREVIAVLRSEIMKDQHRIQALEQKCGIPPPGANKRARAKDQGEKADNGVTN